MGAESYVAGVQRVKRDPLVRFAPLDYSSVLSLGERDILVTLLLKNELK